MLAQTTEKIIIGLEILSGHEMYGIID